MSFTKANTPSSYVVPAGSLHHRPPTLKTLASNVDIPPDLAVTQSIPFLLKMFTSRARTWLRRALVALPALKRSIVVVAMLVQPRPASAPAPSSSLYLWLPLHHP